MYFIPAKWIIIGFCFSILKSRFDGIEFQLLDKTLKNDMFAIDLLSKKIENSVPKIIPPK